jgi:hypothetical protein
MGLEKIRVKLEVSREAAIMAGKAQYGSAVVEIDPGELTEAQRKTLLAFNVVGGAFDLTSSEYFGGFGWSNVYTPLATADAGDVPDILDQAAVWLKKRAGEEEAKKAETVRKITECMADPEKRKTVLKRMVEEGRGLQQALAGSVYCYDSKIPADWWAEHADEYTAEIETVREELTTAKAAEAARIEALQRKRADDYLAKGVDGNLVQTPGAGWHASPFAISDFGPFVAEVAALHNETVAEAERLNARKADDRKAQIEDWIADQGTDNQKKRHAAGLLPEKEIVDEIRDSAFWELDKVFEWYAPLTAGDIPCTCGDDGYDGVDARYNADDAETATAEEFDKLEEIKKEAPEGAKVTLREHVGTCDRCDEFVKRKGITVTVSVGAFDFGREYAV